MAPSQFFLVTLDHHAGLFSILVDLSSLFLDISFDSLDVLPCLCNLESLCSSLSGVLSLLCWDAGVLQQIQAHLASEGFFMLRQPTPCICRRGRLGVDTLFRCSVGEWKSKCHGVFAIHLILHSHVVFLVLKHLYDLETLVFLIAGTAQVNKLQPLSVSLYL